MNPRLYSLEPHNALLDGKIIIGWNVGGRGGLPNTLLSKAPQIRFVRIARAARNMMSNHTDMQDKYCGDC